MSLGATASAPERACEMAVFASSSRVRSLSTLPSSSTIPQWPCEVYPHRHTSVITSRSGCASLIARTASCTTPSSSYAPEPCSSLSAGTPNSRTPGMPSACASPASATAFEIDSRSIPGMASTGVRPSPSWTNIGRTRSAGVSVVSRTSSRSTPVLRRRRSRVAGKGIRPVSLGGPERFHRGIALPEGLEPEDPALPELQQVVQLAVDDRPAGASASVNLEGAHRAVATLLDPVDRRLEHLPLLVEVRQPP